MKKFKCIVTLIFLIGIVALIGCSSNTEEDNNSNPSEKKKEVFNVALSSQPPTLDQPISTASVTRDIGRLIFETLVSTDYDYQAVPQLAEEIEVSEDGKVYTFHLREGVMFHNNKEMVAEDVVASMNRWLEKSSITGNIFDGATWTAEDDYKVVLELKQPSALTLDTLASSKQSAAIMPKEIVEAAPDEGVEEYIGTGPFQFEEWRQDQYIHLKKFADYQSAEGEADGLIGKKEVLFEDLYFHIVQDTTTRLAGLQTGEYDFAYGLSFDYYEELLENPDLQAVISPSANDLIAFNTVEGVASDFKIREAINTALDSEEIMLAAFHNPDLYWLDSGYMDVALTNWASTAGSEYYNQNDPEKAQEILEEAGYNGEEVRILTTRDYDHLYNIGVVVQEQLKNIGMNASLEIYDWPTALEMQSNATNEWDIFVSSSQTVSTPSQLVVLSPTWGAGFEDSKVTDLMSEIETATTLEEAQELWDELQLYAWEELLPVVQLGGNNRFDAARSNVEGMTAFSGPIFWNVSVTE